MHQELQKTDYIQKIITILDTCINHYQFNHIESIYFKNTVFNKLTNIEDNFTIKTKELAKIISIENKIKYQYILHLIKKTIGNQRNIFLKNSTILTTINKEDFINSLNYILHPFEKETIIIYIEEFEEEGCATTVIYQYISIKDRFNKLQNTLIFTNDLFVPIGNNKIKIKIKKNHIAKKYIGKAYNALSKDFKEKEKLHIDKILIKIFDAYLLENKELKICN